MNKIKKIINEEFDTRMTVAVISYIIDKGWNYVSEITDEDINKIEGNELMTQDFVQSLVKAARRITREAELVNEFIPFIQAETNVAGNMHPIDLYKEDMSEYAWEQICDQLDIEPTETEISGMMIVDEE